MTRFSSFFGLFNFLPFKILNIRLSVFPSMQTVFFLLLNHWIVSLGNVPYTDKVPYRLQCRIICVNVTQYKYFFHESKKWQLQLCNWDAFSTNCRKRPQLNFSKILQPIENMKYFLRLERLPRIWNETGWPVFPLCPFARKNIEPVNGHTGLTDKPSIPSFQLGRSPNLHSGNYIPQQSGK